MLDAQLSGSILKKGLDIPFAVGKAVGKLKAIVCLDTFHTDSPACVPLHQTLEEVRGGIGGLLGIGGQKAEPGKLVNSGVLEKTQLRICDTATRDDLHIHLDSLAGIGHLLIGLWSIGLFLLLFWKHTQLAHHAEQALRPAGIPPLPQTVPQFYQAQGRIVAAHIPDLLQLRFCVLVGMAVRTPGLAEARDSTLPSRRFSRSRYTTGFGCTSGWHG